MNKFAIMVEQLRTLPSKDVEMVSNLLDGGMLLTDALKMVKRFPAELLDARERVEKLETFVQRIIGINPRQMNATGVGIQEEAKALLPAAWKEAPGDPALGKIYTFVQNLINSKSYDSDGSRPHPELEVLNALCRVRAQIKKLQEEAREDADVSERCIRSGCKCKNAPGDTMQEG